MLYFIYNLLTLFFFFNVSLDISILSLHFRWNYYRLYVGIYYLNK